MFWVYILECSDTSYYIGHTSCLDFRLKEHNAGKGSTYTKYRSPLKLVYTEKFIRRIDAMKREEQIKRWSRAKKEALIKGDKVKLRKLSRRRKR